MNHTFKFAALGFLGCLALGSVVWYAVDAPLRPMQSTKHGNETINLTSNQLATPAKPTEIIAAKDRQSIELDIVSIEKTIDGKKVSMWGYNGSVPGPTIRAEEDSEITIVIKNSSPFDTTMHPHGIRVDNMFDGVPGLTQKPIQSGDTFSYTLKLSDPGVFWYHPHIRTDYAVESGLYGNIIVEPKDEAYYPKVSRDIPIILDDIALDSKGLLPFDEEKADHALMGRFGNAMLINGETSFDLQANQGEIVRLYLTNAANTRVFNFSIPGASLKLIAGDLGRYTQEQFVDNIIIAPGERRIVDVFFAKSGTYDIVHTTPDKQYMLGKVMAEENDFDVKVTSSFANLRRNSDEMQSFDAIFAKHFERHPDKNLSLSFDMQMMARQGMSHGMHSMEDGTIMQDNAMHDTHFGNKETSDGIEWEDTMNAMNQASTSKTILWKMIDTDTGKVNLDIDDWHFRKGDMVKISITNDPNSMHPMQHPIHFHGQRFVVLSRNGIRNSNPVWSDTELLGVGDTVDILLEASNPGSWTTHCHILEHAESGMMLGYTVEE